MELANLILTAIVGLFAVYLKSYMNKKGEALATREQFEEVTRQLEQTTKVTEETKNMVLRTENARTTGAHSIMETLATIETSLLDWEIFLYFRKDELEPDQTIEEIGRSDLKSIAKLLTKLHTTLSTYRIFFSKELLHLTTEYSNKIRLLLFSYESAYLSSIQTNEGKDVDDTVRLQNVQTALNFDAKAKFDELPPLKDSICKKLIEELKIG